MKEKTIVPLGSMVFHTLGTDLQPFHSPPSFMVQSVESQKGIRKGRYT